MTMQTYNLVPSRSPIYAERAMLAHAQPLMVFSNFGKQVEMPKNKTDTIVLRRALPVDANSSTQAPIVNASDYLLQEGVTPSARTIQYFDVQAVMQQYGILFKLSSKAQTLYEDNIPGDMVELTGEHLGTLQEMIAINVVKGGTNVVYANGAARATLNTPVNLSRLRNVARVLENGHAKRVTKRLAPSASFATAPVHPAYVVFIHTDLEADIRNMPGFIPVAEYGSFQTIHEREVGAVEQFRFISTTYLRPYLAAGSATLNGMLGTGNTDVYPIIVTAQDAWGQVAVKGMGAIKPVYLPPSQVNHANPLAMFGYVGAQFWKTAVRLNENWMVRYEVCATIL